MNTGKYYYNITNGRCFIKLVGHIHYNTSAGFENFVSNIIKKNNIDDILIDMSETNGIDSTNLGLIAKLANFMKRMHGKKITLITANPDVNTILESMGFFEIFIIVSKLPNGAYDFNEIESLSSDVRNMAEIMLDAHSELMKLNEKNRETFKDIVSMLKHEIDEKDRLSSNKC